MKSYCLALFFGLIALVTAQSSSTSPFYITNPLPGTVLKAGDSIDLEWNNGLDQTVKVLVIQGANSGTMSPTDISFDVEGEDGTHTFKVPRSLSPAGTYAFQFEYKDDSGSPRYAYSGPVTVTGGTGTVEYVSATASVAHASSSMASSLPTPSASAIAVASSSAVSAPVSSPSSGFSASGKTSAAASTTPIPSSASNNLITGFALTMPILLALFGLQA